MLQAQHGGSGCSAQGPRRAAEPHPPRTSCMILQLSSASPQNLVEALQFVRHVSHWALPGPRGRPSTCPPWSECQGGQSCSTSLVCMQCSGSATMYHIMQSAPMQYRAYCSAPLSTAQPSLGSATPARCPLQLQQLAAARLHQRRPPQLRACPLPWSCAAMQTVAAGWRDPAVRSTQQRRQATQHAEAASYPSVAAAAAAGMMKCTVHV